jgi:hypothetical protein
MRYPELLFLSRWAKTIPLFKESSEIVQHTEVSLCHCVQAPVFCPRQGFISRDLNLTIIS